MRIQLIMTGKYIHIEAYYGKFDIINLLLRRTLIEINAFELREKTSLALAIEQGRTEAVQALIKSQKVRC